MINKNKYQCSQCGKKFRLIVSYREHLKTHNFPKKLFKYKKELVL